MIFINILSTFQAKQSFITNPLSLNAAGRSEPKNRFEHDQQRGHSPLDGTVVGGAHCPLCNLALLAQKTNKSGASSSSLGRSNLPGSHLQLLLLLRWRVILFSFRRRMRGDLNLHANHMFSPARWNRPTKTTSSRSGSPPVMKTYLA